MRSSGVLGGLADPSVRKMDLGPFKFGFWCLMINKTKLD
jgi:hypothetical protein